MHTMPASCEEDQREALARLGLLASAIAHRPLQVAPAAAGELAWTDGSSVFVDVNGSARAQLESLVVQASLLCAGSLDREVLQRLPFGKRVLQRYLALEGHRALARVDALLPRAARALARPEIARLSASPLTSLALARGQMHALTAPESFGTIRPQQLLAAWRAAQRAQRMRPKPVELVDGALAEDSTQDAITSPLGAGGAIGRWLSKLLSAARRARGGGSPGADAPTHWTRRSARGQRETYSAATTATIDVDAPDERVRASLYPEWDVHAQQYRKAFCSVLELEPELHEPDAADLGLDRTGLRRALARHGLGSERLPRQRLGDDLDIDALVEARVELMSGSTPHDAIYVRNAQRRHNLAVLILLDVSGSAGEPAANGQSVHAQQRAAAAALTLTLHELGDRVALYAYRSQGRSAVHLTPVKRFAEVPGPRLLQRLQSLQAGAYSRLGAAIRHGTAVLRDHGGTPRQLLLVLSDGMAYDHGYEPVYGAADAQRALAEARHQGVGCLCLSVGASTDVDALRSVFGASAHAFLPTPAELQHVIAKLFRSALRSADVRRRVS